jgi:hypothetical protein
MLSWFSISLKSSAYLRLMSSPILANCRPTCDARLQKKWRYYLCYICKCIVHCCFKNHKSIYTWY